MILEEACVCLHRKVYKCICTNTNPINLAAGGAYGPKLHVHTYYQSVSQ